MSWAEAYLFGGNALIMAHIFSRHPGYPRCLFYAVLYFAIAIYLIWTSGT